MSEKIKAFRITISRPECVKTFQTSAVVMESQSFPNIWETADGLLRNFCLSCPQKGEYIHFIVKFEAQGSYAGEIKLKPSDREKGSILARHIWEVNAYWAGQFTNGQTEEERDHQCRLHPEEVREATEMLERYEIPYTPELEDNQNAKV